MWRRRTAAVLVGSLALLDPWHAGGARAHEAWSDGTPVPDWVRNACCGPADVHHLQPSQVHRVAGGYAVDGIRAEIPWAKTLPSEDGEYWIFYRTFDDGSQYVFCFFAPPDGS